MQCSQSSSAMSGQQMSFVFSSANNNPKFCLFMASEMQQYSIHVIFIQFYIPCSTICSIFNFYSMFNASVPLNLSFNIQLFIQCSTFYCFYSTFNDLFNVQLFIQHNDLFNVQLFIQHSTIYSMFNFFSSIQLLIQYSTF